jgi:hypothetical protein
MTHDARREAAYARCLHDRVPDPVAEVPSVTGPPCGAVNTRASRGRADISTDMPSRVWETSLKADRLIISTTSTYRWSIICSSVCRPGTWERHCACERDWLCRVFGEDWLGRLEPDPKTRTTTVRLGGTSTARARSWRRGWDEPIESQRYRPAG